MGTMASHSSRHIKAAVFILALHITFTKSAKLRQPDSGSPVYEVINEQARIDDKPRQQTGSLPYGNPLAGNSKQNARLHAQNQQAMFNAEKIRQHRAQLQRWAQISQVDSYMKAYHDSQEDHQLAVEQQQANLRERKQNIEQQQASLRDRKQSVEQMQANLRDIRDRKQSPITTTRKPVTRRSQRPKLEPLKKGIRVIPEAIRITKDDAIKTEKSRSHRSYGSVEYQQYLQPKMYKTVYVSPAPTYDQGVTIKPNGNVGLAGHKANDETKLYTKAVPSKTQYVYSKPYGPMQGYESAQNIETLNSLLKKNPQEQLSQLNALMKPVQEETKDDLNSNIDLYFYLKDPPSQSLIDHYDNSLYAQVQPQYASAYTPEVKDHTPITEEVDDVENPNKDETYQGYGIQTVLTATEAPQMDTTTTKSNNYYKVEVASQTISSGFKPTDLQPERHEALHYKPLKFYLQKELKVQGDKSERYLHHNAKPTGVQHLTEDGSGVSAYDEDSLHYAANYEFGYRVRDLHSGNDFGHHEAKIGEKTNGHYHVLLPDGRMQNVQYSAGPEGFHADISYDHLQ